MAVEDQAADSRNLSTWFCAGVWCPAIYAVSFVAVPRDDTESPEVW